MVGAAIRRMAGSGERVLAAVAQMNDFDRHFDEKGKCDVLDDGVATRSTPRECYADSDVSDDSSSAVP